MLEQLEHTRGVPHAEINALVTRDDHFRGRKCRPHHETREIQALVGGSGSEHAFFFAGRAKFNAIILGR